MAKLIRTLYVIIPTLAYCISVWLSYSNELLMITLFLFGLIANILCITPLQIENAKRKEPPALPLFLLALPFALWCWGSGSLQFLTWPFFHFFAMSLFLLNVTPFLLGMALSPIISRMYGGSHPDSKEVARSGIEQIKKSGFLPFMIFLLAGTLASLYFASDLFVAQMVDFSDLVFYCTIAILAFFGIVIIRLTYRSSIWGDPQVYHYDRTILRDYFNLAPKKRNHPEQ
jgi:hypothetical protein